MFYKSIHIVNTIKNYYLQNFLPDSNLEFWGKNIKKGPKRRQNMVRDKKKGGIRLQG